MRTLLRTSLKVADEAWIALALLHRENPDRISFSAREIFEKVRRESLHPELRAGIQPHISLHNVANVPANSARYRMFYRMENGGYRLFRSGDDYHASRSGKIRPESHDVPEDYRELIDWYDSYYNGQTRPEDPDEQDPFMRMRGFGKEIWTNLDVDNYLEALRAGWDTTDSHKRSLQSMDQPVARPEIAREIWNRLVRCQGENFKTKRGLPFQYQIEGSSGIWFYRDGKRIEQRLSRTEFETALRELPLSGPRDIKRLRDPSYLYGLLADTRIIGNL